MTRSPSVLLLVIALQPAVAATACGQEPAPPARRPVPMRLSARGEGAPAELRNAWTLIVDASREHDELLELGCGLAGWSVPQGARPAAGDGALTLELPEGRHVVVAGAEGCDTQVFDLEVTALPLDRPLEVPLRWVGVARARLRLVDAQAAPLASFTLTVRLERGPLDVELLDVTTDAEGRAELARRPGPATLSGEPGPMRFPSLPPATERRRCPRVTVELAAGRTTDVELRLLGPEHRAGLHVRVVDRGGAPVPAAYVALQPPDAQATEPWRLLGPDGSPPRASAGAHVRDADWSARSVHTDEAGWAHLLDEDRPGEPLERVLVVARRSYDVGRAEARHAPGEVTTARVTLDTPVVRGRARLSLKAPGGGPFEGDIGWIGSDSTGERLHAFPDEVQDVLLIHDLAPGLVSLVLRGAARFEPAALGVGGGGPAPDPKRPTDAGLVARVDLEVVAGQTTVQTVQLERALLLEVRLLQPDGRPYHGPVRVRREATDALAAGRTTRDGLLWIREVHADDAVAVGVEVDGGRTAWLPARTTSERQELRLPGP